MQADVNKVYLTLADHEVLWYSLITMVQNPSITRIVLVARPEDRPYLDGVMRSVRGAVRQGQLVSRGDSSDEALGVETPIMVTDGGATRHASERAGLLALRPHIVGGELDVVAVHDGARPFVSTFTVNRVIKGAATVGGAIPVLPVEDTVYSRDHRDIIDADELVWAQTPQAFTAAVVLDAHEQAADVGFAGVDTAEVVANFTDQRIVAVPGDRANIKVTFADDLTEAESLARDWHQQAQNPIWHPRFLRSNQYNQEWVANNQMGPNALWLLESLMEHLTVEPGSRVLDLGCGNAMTSIFLAKEYGSHVTAADLWIAADENRERVEAAGVADLVEPVQAEAHTLPFEANSFDAIVSIDAYQYFGTDDLYLGAITNYLKPGGKLGIVVPSMVPEPMPGVVPEHLAPYWEWEFCCFHSPRWWRDHWAKTGLVDVDVAAQIPQGWLDWLWFTEYTAPFMTGWRAESARKEIEMLGVDRGRHLGFALLVATKPASSE